MAFTTFIGYLYNPLTSLVGLMVPIQEILVYTKRFYEVYDSKPEVTEPSRPVRIRDFRGRVAYGGISFGYQPDRPVLKDINIEIPAGTKVAIVGKTGAGKSTLVGLLPRFYDPWTGSVTIDGIDIRNMSLGYLRSKIGLVMQSPFLFVGTIYENITCGRKSFTRDQVVEAAKAANAHDFISEFPLGYDTWVGENAVTLSGGELQRIAMARVFLLDRPILILDEATSSVDMKTEALIREAFARLTKGRTTFVIAHRLTTVQDADLILVMDKGRIVEQGDHPTLMNQGGVYWRLFRGAPVFH
ncbi:MAG: ATP-binding cassette domain-containing protein [Deltaproteobacteria bacterium]|nr:ATP-binding cassette domain-containing protein [Deltaproteobacteria bacterium]